MATNTYTAGCSCCFTGTATAPDPLDADHTVPAGDVCANDVCMQEEAPECFCKLAMIYFPMQTYRAGYCPCDALKKGTLFPELVSKFVPGGCV